MLVRKDKTIENELEEKYNIIWDNNVGYIRNNNICTELEIENIFNEIIDNRLRAFGIAPELIK